VNLFSNGHYDIHEEHPRVSSRASSTPEVDQQLAEEPIQLALSV